MKPSLRLEAILKLKDHPLKLSDLIRTAQKFDLSPIQMSLLADISLRTFKTKPKSSPLSFHISERVLILNDVYQIGLDVFSLNKISLQTWLKSKVPALDNHTPNDLLTSLLGIDIVKEELLRIKHGVH